MKTAGILAAIALCVPALFAQDFKLGGKVADFALQTAAGEPVQYSKLAGDTTVVMFVSTQCPVSNAYNERMKALYSSYASKGVRFVFINSNASETGAQVAEHAKAQGFPFQVYKDSANLAADRFDAQVTPESFVIAKGVIVYHGAVDDNRNEAQVSSKALRAALDAALAGRPVAQNETKAFGCSIKRAKKTT
ncbi:MAG: redoxin domain-containing protein [Acidobacteria bacterium]|nr:redoxin domain-containing protein [Acidobacteriota bacterium]